MNAMQFFASRPIRGATAAFLAAAGISWPAHAQVTFQVSFNDPGATHATFYGKIRKGIRAAGEEWASYLNNGAKAALQVEVSFEDIATASTGSVTNWFLGQYNGYSLYEQGATHEIRTGEDPNGKAPDIHMSIGSLYLQNELWFDPSPRRQVAPVPLDRTDARSLFLHELGHALGFNGWRDPVTGELPGGYESTFDAWVSPQVIDGQTILAFDGPSASLLYGGPVPLTLGRYAHLGNEAPLPGSDLMLDLMNGVSFFRGTRYHITPLDLAILRDAESLLPLEAAAAVGDPLAAPLQAAPIPAVPEPSTWWLAAAGLALMGVVRARRRRQ
ncbi:PEP-CTERM sorting domain-containing protein [Piscinibacter sp. XHJ-5]|uniref:PEP-CTERM sorting domain-containing protein n=1 Tax=Piscinibacter sp. XHJ-5 TaxID=3037797 RepID=UPI002452A3BF|nr:PEP-CTERM sorting domain-containing protein [Piscinibacter sp. XHJ-5]